MSSSTANGEAGAARLRFYTQENVHEAFNEFLGITEQDRRLLARYHDVLLEGSEHFAEVFYDYLLSYPATAQIFERYRENGGEIRSLVNSQLAHLWRLLSGRIDADSARRLAHIGEIHCRFGVEPVWVMGAYLLYWDHLRARLGDDSKVASNDRKGLENAVTRFLFRDMGLMLEGYWDAALEQVSSERNKVHTLQEQITSLLANLPQVLWSVDVERNRPLYVSPTSRRICEMDVEMPIPCLNWTVDEDREAVRQAWRKALTGRQVEVESRVRAPDGELRWFRRVFHPFTNEEGCVVRIDGLMEDATEAKQTLERLHDLATTDSLTGLSNRTLLLDRLNRAVAVARRSQPPKQVVLMIMDLDHFKEINDTLGHPVGDEVLRTVSQRLADRLRDSDTLARLGGDEFAVLLPEVDNAWRTGEHVAGKLLECFNEPVRVAGQELYLGASIGIAVFPDHGDTVENLMSRADVVMYEVKRAGSGFGFYDASSDPHTPQRLRLMTELRNALEQDQLCLHYQAKIDTVSGVATGVEALLRWQHPERGLLYPDEFLPMAMRTGLLNPMTDWVLNEAMRQCMKWHNEGFAIPVAVNVDAFTFQQSDFAERIDAMLQETGASPACLEIEITENLLSGDMDNCSGVLARLAARGVSFAIDDYGTGYSSLAWLKRLPLKTLKIDKSFVMDMCHDENDAVIVRSTVDLAHNLGYTVVAEGVEDAEILQLLQILGCDSAQGYHIARPMAPDALMDWLRQRPGP
jgi:diguanylate cyclase (GGDEF)-like protein